MNKNKNIKFKNVITKGLLAGIIILIIGSGLLPVMGNRLKEILDNYGIAPMGTDSMIFFAMLSLISGISIIGIYAFIENRFESKLKVTIILCFVFWFYIYFLSSAALVAYGFMPLSFVIKGTSWGLLEVFVAGFIGTSLYNKAQAK